MKDMEPCQCLLVFDHSHKHPKVRSTAILAVPSSFLLYLLSMTIVRDHQKRRQVLHLLIAARIFAGDNTSMIVIQKGD